MSALRRSVDHRRRRPRRAVRRAHDNDSRIAAGSQTPLRPGDVKATVAVDCRGWIRICANRGDRRSLLERRDVGDDRPFCEFLSLIRRRGDDDGIGIVAALKAAPHAMNVAGDRIDSDRGSLINS